MLVPEPMQIPVVLNDYFSPFDIGTPKREKKSNYVPRRSLRVRGFSSLSIIVFLTAFSTVGVIFRAIISGRLRSISRPS